MILQISGAIFWSIFFKWAIPGLFLFIFVFSIQLIINKCSIKFCRWLESNLWYRKRPLYQLSHNHFPLLINFCNELLTWSESCIYLFFTCLGSCLQRKFSCNFCLSSLKKMSMLKDGNSETAVLSSDQSRKTWADTNEQHSLEAEIAHLLQKGKCHCTADLLFYLLGFSCLT